jgi:hypothetical protein
MKMTTAWQLPTRMMAGGKSQLRQITWSTKRYTLGDGVGLGVGVGVGVGLGDGVEVGLGVRDG